MLSFSDKIMLKLALKHAFRHTIFQTFSRLRLQFVLFYLKTTNSEVSPLQFLPTMTILFQKMVHICHFAPTPNLRFLQRFTFHPVLSPNLGQAILW